MRKKISNKVYAAIALMIIILGAAIAVFAYQNFFSTPKKEYSPGINVGDTFTYSIKGYSELLDENSSTPEKFYDFNKTDYYRVTITAVSDPIVNFTTSWRFSNGTQISGAHYINVETGDNDEEFWAIYAANLTVGSLVRPTGIDGAIVNSTDIESFASGDREYNLMQLQSQFTNLDDPTYSTMYMDYIYVHFDTKTGMLIELSEIKIYNDPSLILRLVWKLVDTNVWTVS